MTADVDDVDESTQLAARRSTTPADPVDETTQAGSRRRSVADPAPDDQTEIGRRRGSAAPPADAPPPDSERDDLDEATNLVRRRRMPVVGDEPDADLDDGSTVVVRRESRRRAEAAAAAAGDEPAEDTVIARSAGTPGVSTVPPTVRRPSPETPASYAPRLIEPAQVPRATSAARAPQAFVDTAAVEQTRRRLARRRLVIVLVVGAVAVVVASVLLVALIFAT